VFLLSTVYQGLAVSNPTQVMLFAFAAVCSAAMVVIAIPLTRTSWMVQVRSEGQLERRTAGAKDSWSEGRLERGDSKSTTTLTYQ